VIENAFLLTSQENLIWGHKCGVGGKLPPEHVRAAMLIRANALSRGLSGVRKEVIERLLAFLNHGLTPVVRELGSIGASGDLIPLAQVAGCIVGLGASYRAVNREGEEVDALSALESMGLAPLQLQVRGQVIIDRDGFRMWGLRCACGFDSLEKIEVGFRVYLEGRCKSRLTRHKRSPPLLRSSSCQLDMAP
jgi:phenylalanine ammonia-lyase